MALASTEDYTLRTGTALSGDLETRVAALLASAESAVLAAAYGQTIESAAFDVIARPYEGILYLPQRPVTDITSVAVVNADGSETDLTEGTDYRWEAGGNGRPAVMIRRFGGRDTWWGRAANAVGWINSGDESEIHVVGVAGWDPAPPQIVGICVAMVKAVIDNSGGPAPTQKTVGPFSASFDAAEARSATMAVTPSDQKIIDRLCKLRTPTSVPVVRSAP